MQLKLNVPANFVIEYPTISLVDLLKDQIKDDNSISISNKKVIDSLLVVIKDIVNQCDYNTNSSYSNSGWSNKTIGVLNEGVNKYDCTVTMTNSNHCDCCKDSDCGNECNCSN